MRRFALTAAALLLLLPYAPAGAQDRGYASMLLGVPTAQGALDDVARLNQEAHYPGSIGDRDMAQWMRDKLQSYGFDARIETIRAQVPQLKRAVLQLLVKPRVDFDLKETRIPSDPDGSRPDAGIPFNAWSGSGDVTTNLVYANRGTAADYRALDAAGISVARRIVLIRYGAAFRGQLARRAAKRGAVGVIFYSDPDARDGSARGAAYPNGPYRPTGSVQRGSVGTPTMKIPVLPVSARTAQRLLQDISGAPPPTGWHGGLDADYALGVSHNAVHLRVDMVEPWMTLWNTIGVLPGRDASREVILGGHRDAWVYGATDNGSGISTLLEAAHALGYVYRAGWRPAYSIVIAGWDGEEIGELGSEAYVRTHFARLSRGCIAYVNADETATGQLFAADAAAAVAHLIPQIARRVTDPYVKAASVLDAWRGEPGGVRSYNPGGGSDFEPFLYFAGVPTLEFGFEGPFGVYHSAFDDLRYATTQADPDFAAHRALAQLLALLAYRMTLGPLPYDLAAYPAVMARALSQVAGARGGDALASVTDAIARLSDAVAQRPLVAPQREIDAVHRLDLVLYGRSGYAPVAFPTLAAALATGNADRIQTAAKKTVDAIEAATAELR